MEVTAPMLTQLRRRLPEWKVCRRSEVSEDYFNVTVMRHGSERTMSLMDFVVFWDYDFHTVFGTTGLSTNSLGDCL